jgi:hypothetical protein
MTYSRLTSLLSTGRRRPAPVCLAPPLCRPARLHVPLAGLLHRDSIKLDSVFALPPSTTVEGDDEHRLRSMLFVAASLHTNTTAEQV